MFSGIVETKGLISSCIAGPDGARLAIDARIPCDDVSTGDSVCVDGVCLTVITKKESLLSFDAVNETLRRTTLGSRKAGDEVNIEKSLRVGERIHGHFVSGHVDCVAAVLERAPDGESTKIVCELPPDIARLVSQKGSITLSGVSLTVAERGRDYFSVYVIPHTLSETILGSLEAGSKVNVEVDMLARYVDTILAGSAR